MTSIHRRLPCAKLCADDGAVVLEAIVALALFALIVMTAQTLLEQSLRQSVRANNVRKTIEELIRSDSCIIRLPWPSIDGMPRFSQMMRGYCDDHVAISPKELPASIRSYQRSLDRKQIGNNSDRILVLHLPTLSTNGAP